jgi:hypothetical protein
LVWLIDAPPGPVKGHLIYQAVSDAQRFRRFWAVREKTKHLHSKMKLSIVFG